jgi:hypothetical protein
MTKYLVLKPYSGIADRVRLILFGLQLAKKSGRELVVVWEKSFHLGCEFYKLFQANGFTVADDDRFCGEALADYTDSSEYAIEKVVLASTVDIFKMRAFVDSWSYDKFGELFQSSAEVSALYADFNIRSFPAPWIGINVRAADKKDEMPPLEEYFAKADKLLEAQPASKIYLCTDGGDEILSAFDKHYGNRLIHYPMRSLDRNSEEHCIDAVVTLYLLKRCLSLVTSNYSGFSRLAAGRSRREMPGKIGVFTKL